MDRHRPSSSDNTGREDQDNGGVYSSEHTEDVARKTKLRLMNWLAMIGLGLTVGQGVAASHVSVAAAIIIGLVAGVILILIGMGIMSLHKSIEFSALRESLSVQREALDLQRDWEVKNTIIEERKACSEVIVRFSREVSNRVANRLIARYAPNLNIAEHREAIFQETDQIVNEELAAFSLAIDKESGGQKKS